MLWIPAGDAYRQDYVTPKCVLGIDPEDLSLIEAPAAGGFVRDDSEQLESIAKLAFQWYGTPRTSLSFETSRLTESLFLGDFVQKIGDPALPGDTHIADINSCVTEVTIQIPGGIGQTTVGVPTVRYVTAYGELDPLRV